MNKLISTSLCLVLVSGVLNAQLPSVGNSPDSKNQLFTQQEVSIFPNPSTRGILNFAGLSNYNDSDFVKIYIYNLNGKLVLSNNLSVQSGMAELKIDELVEGEYTIRVETDDQIFRSRLIVTD